MRYFDYCATTPLDEEILETYIKVQKHYFANTNSIHRLGEQSNELLKQATEEIQAMLNVEHNIIYTGNATEANNLAIFGIVKKHQKGKIITTMIEHPSVYNPFKQLEAEGYDVKYIPVDHNGIIDLNLFEKELDKETVLVSIMWVNNIIGQIQPIKQVIEMMKKFPKARLHVDTVQGLCKIIPDFSFNDIDMMTMSIHKIYGPKGIGMLFINRKLELHKLLFGANNNGGIKPGTLDLALAVASCKAIKKYYPLTAINYQKVLQMSTKLKNAFKKMANIIINSDDQCSPYIVNISIKKYQAETLVHILEQKEIYVSSGSACSSKNNKPERTILAMSDDLQRAKSSIRISLSHLTTDEEIDVLIKEIGEINNV